MIYITKQTVKNDEKIASHYTYFVIDNFQLVL